jgi:hypothetical protein
MTGSSENKRVLEFFTAQIDNDHTRKLLDKIKIVRNTGAMGTARALPHSSRVIIGNAGGISEGNTRAGLHPCAETRKLGTGYHSLAISC